MVPPETILQQLERSKSLSDEDRIREKIRIIREGLRKVAIEGGEVGATWGEGGNEEEGDSDGEVWGVKESSDTNSQPVLPQHPRTLARKMNHFHDNITSLIDTLCPAASNLNNLTAAWGVSMSRYVAIMKIGFPVGDWRDKIEDDGMIKEGEEGNLGRVFLSGDGRHVVFRYPGGENGETGGDVKVNLGHFVDAVLVEVEEGKEGERMEGGYNDIGLKLTFSEGAEGEKYSLGPFKPPTELEVKSWYLVMKMFTAGKGRGEEEGKMEKVKVMCIAEMTKTMGLGEAFKDVKKVV